MAQRFNYYVIVGDNGYGMSQDFSDIVQAAKQLRNEWHRGFQTEEEAYEYIKDQTFFRYALRSAGICDIDTLRAQKIVLLDDPVPTQSPARAARTVAGGRYSTYPAPVKPRVIKGLSLADCLDMEEEEDKHIASQQDQKNKDNLFKAFMEWYSTHGQQKQEG